MMDNVKTEWYGKTVAMTQREVDVNLTADANMECILMIMVSVLLVTIKISVAISILCGKLTDNGLKVIPQWNKVIVCVTAPTLEVMIT